jgi:glycosyltransferase involved in cell wall biosynthesis
MQVSIAIVARDAQKTLPTCLDSIKNLTDDIVIIIDNRTEDNTSEVAKRFGARVYTRQFDDYSGQKNFALSLTQYDWVLSLDADESASPELVKAIRDLPIVSLFPAFRIPRKNKIFGKYIKYTNWDPFGLIRLFDKNKCHWSGEVHEEIVAEGTVGRLYDPIYHDNYRTMAEFMTRQDHYSTLEANRLFKQGIKFSWGQLLWQPAYDFFRRFIIHTGFLDGWHGLYLSYLMAIYHLSVWIKLWQRYQKVSS